MCDIPYYKNNTQMGKFFRANTYFFLFSTKSYRVNYVIVFWYKVNPSISVIFSITILINMEHLYVVLVMHILLPSIIFISDEGGS